MAIIPTSWNDQNMDWDYPNPTELKYSLALFEAVKERIDAIPATLRNTMNSYSAGIPNFYSYACGLPSENVAIDYDFLRYIRDATVNMTPFFIDTEYSDWETPNDCFYISPSAGFGVNIVYTVFPKPLFPEQIQEKAGDNFATLPARCCSHNDLVEFFKSTKKALDCMRYTKIKNCCVKTSIIDSARHDPPYPDNLYGIVSGNVNPVLHAKDYNWTDFYGRIYSSSTWYNNGSSSTGNKPRLLSDMLVYVKSK